MMPFLSRLRKTFDYTESGGAPLLGVDGICMICHGTSSPKAIKNGVFVASQMHRHNISENIRKEMATNGNGIKNGQENKSENNRSGITPPIPSSD